MGRLIARPAAGTVTRLAIVVTALGLSLFAPSSAAAVRSEFFGIVQGPTLDDRDLQGIRAAHIHTSRYLLAWESVQKQAGPFTWGTTDRFIGRLASHGIRLIPTLWGNPDWVSGYTARAPLDRPQDIQAWRDFLKGVVGRYGRGGTYWGAPYHQKYGPGATPLPIQAYQVWNEPNLKKYFVPYPSAKKYGKLVGISHDAIKSKDPQAQILLAGMPSNGDVLASDFLNQLYNQVPGIKADFDLAALHPYASSIDKQRQGIERFRMVMTNHGDAATPLWLTELAWGSAAPDRFGINKGISEPGGQATFLKGSFKLVLSHRKAWNVQRLLWYHWRDPQTSHASCSFCASAGLLKYNRNQKPAFFTFKSFTAETTPPQASITAGPSQGGVTSDATPTFSFKSNEPGSTFECKVDVTPFKSCSSPYTLPPLSNGAHTFSVRATDAPGNVSAVVSRSFTVDTTP
jgi:polysaccharide biosynthesis protein PslG